MMWKVRPRGRSVEADILAITGLSLQLVALFSNSWLLIERVEPPHCLTNKRTVSSSAISCTMSPYNTSEIARAGLWTICYSFPHVDPPGHTEPYCSDFVEDIFQVDELTTIQMLCVLSTCLSLIGSIHISVSWCFSHKESILWSSAFNLLAIGGLCGLTGCCYIHFYMTKEYLVFSDHMRTVMYKWWSFHVFLDGSIASLAAWLINGWAVQRNVCSC